MEKGHCRDRSIKRRDIEGNGRQKTWKNWVKGRNPQQFDASDGT